MTTAWACSLLMGVSMSGRVVWWVWSEMDQGIVLVTGGYDHSLKFWYPHDGVCYRTTPHPDSVSIN